MTATDTTPVKRRLTNSITPWEPVSPWGTKLSCSQRGHVEHPNPEPVRRTAAPVTTMIPSATRASSVIRRYARGVSRSCRTPPAWPAALSGCQQGRPRPPGSVRTVAGAWSDQPGGA